MRVSSSADLDTTPRKDRRFGPVEPGKKRNNDRRMEFHVMGNVT